MSLSLSLSLSLSRGDFDRLLRDLPRVPYDTHPEPDGTYTFHIRQRLYATLSHLAPHLRARPEWTVLDLGAFPGSFLRTLPAVWPDLRFRFEAAGLAENAEFLEDLDRLGIDWHRVNLDPLFADDRPLPSRLPHDGPSFDLVLATEIVEHLLDPTHMLGEARRVARPGALLVVSTPNLATLYRRMAFLVRGQSPNVPIEDSLMSYRGDWRPHIREFTTAELSQVLARSGWRVEEVHYYSAERRPGSGLRRRAIDELGRIGAKWFPSTSPDLLVLARPAVHGSRE